MTETAHHCAEHSGSMQMLAHSVDFADAITMIGRF
jgi:hypothetical protein